MRKDEVINKLSEHLDEIREVFFVKDLILFGSVARDEMGPESDVDMLVEFEQPATFDGYMDLKLYLEDLLNSRVDLVTKKALKPKMRRVVEKEAVRVA